MAGQSTSRKVIRVGKGWPDKKKSKEPKKNARVSFEIEENARDLFLESIKRIDPKAKAEEASEEKGANSKSGRTKSEKGRTSTIDLHHCTLIQAKAKIDSVFANAMALTTEPVKVVVITGKGIHSKGRESILASEIHRYVLTKYEDFILKIDDSPAATKLTEAADSIPLKGYFTVVLKGIK